MTLSPTLTATTQTAASAVLETLRAIARSGPDYGRIEPAQPRRVLVEFVSADPNGPLTAAHGRGAVLGDTVASLLAFAGHEVTREFYVNDATNSKQMRRFAHALLYRYREALGLPAQPTDEGYPDEYVRAVAYDLIERDEDTYAQLEEADALTAIQQTAAILIREEQRETLERLGVRFDHWFSESALHARGAVETVLEKLRAGGHAYEQNGALWLRSTAFGDEADRTLVRADGTPTYLAGDLAYHADKFERGFDLLIDIWSADHAGYIERTRAGLAALGYDADRLNILLHGPVRLLKDGTEVRDDRYGGAPTLEEILDEIPPETARLQYLRRPAEQPLDLDADAVLRDDATNPTACLRRALAHPGGMPGDSGELIEALGAFPSTVESAARLLAPHDILGYALGVADRWRDTRGDAPEPLRDAVAAVLTNALRLLGVPTEPTHRTEPTEPGT
jgi:arginyl-tRNA synthetase